MPAAWITISTFLLKLNFFDTSFLINVKLESLASFNLLEVSNINNLIGFFKKILNDLKVSLSGKQIESLTKEVKKYSLREKELSNSKLKQIIKKIK